MSHVLAVVNLGEILEYRVALEHGLMHLHQTMEAGYSQSQICVKCSNQTNTSP